MVLERWRAGERSDWTETPRRPRNTGRNVRSRTFDSLLFRPRTGLCRKTICLVDRLPSLAGERRKKKEREDKQVKNRQAD